MLPLEKTFSLRALLNNKSSSKRQREDRKRKDKVNTQPILLTLSRCIYRDEEYFHFEKFTVQDLGTGHITRVSLAKYM